MINEDRMRSVKKVLKALEDSKDNDTHLMNKFSCVPTKVDPIWDEIIELVKKSEGMINTMEGRGWGPDFEDEYALDLMTGNVVKMIVDEGDTIGCRFEGKMISIPRTQLDVKKDQG